MSIEAKRLVQHGPEHIARLEAGKAAAMAKRKELFLSEYNPKLSLYKNAVAFGVEYTTVRRWCEQDEEFFSRVLSKDQIYKQSVVDSIQDVCISAAKGDIYTETTYYDSKGNIKQTAKYQQQPSYKHAEIMLRAFDPDTYKPEQAANVAITINMESIDGTGNAVEIDAIDISNDPGQGLSLF